MLSNVYSDKKLNLNCRDYEVVLDRNKPCIAQGEEFAA